MAKIFILYFCTTNCLIFFKKRPNKYFYFQFGPNKYLLLKIMFNINDVLLSCQNLSGKSI